MSVVFVDTETTGLDPDRHEIWEIALIVDGTEHHWLLPPNLTTADPMALQVGRFYERSEERHEQWLQMSHDTHAVSMAVCRLTANRQLVGINPAFDALFLDRLIRSNGFVPAWHYHMIDVKALAAGWLHGFHSKAIQVDNVIGAPPWSTDDLCRAVGPDPDEFDRHTALGDARMARAMYEAVMA